MSVSPVPGSFFQFVNNLSRNPFTQIQISSSQKIIILSVSAGVAVLAVLAQYLKRRKKTSAFSMRRKLREQLVSSQRLGSPNGDKAFGGGSRSSPRSVHRQPSILSVHSDIRSSISGPSQPAARLTPQQLGVMGMEALETSINYWEDALAAYQEGGEIGLCLTDQEEAEFCQELQDLLDLAYKAQRKCELLFLDQRSVLFRAESSARSATEVSSLRRNGCYSSADSFVSAQDEVADLREFEEFGDLSANVDALPLYQSSMKHFEEHGIPYRCLRTELVGCSSDLEYLVKLHCVRLSFQWLFKDDRNWQYFVDSGRQVLSDILLFADKDPKDLLIAYEEMMQYLDEKDAWKDIEAELSLKGVKALTFYDVVLDYILMDAFDDLDSPPSSVTAVVQNRWLSNGFKESALATAVWSVLKAKRRMLTYPNGFMAHFYSISEQMSPLMAWGFLGPDENLKHVCQYFKEQVLASLGDIFSFERSRFTTVEELSEDIMKHVTFRVKKVNVKLNKPKEQYTNQ